MEFFLRLMRNFAVDILDRGGVDELIVIERWL